MLVNLLLHVTPVALVFLNCGLSFSCFYDINRDTKNFALNLNLKKPKKGK